MNTETAYLSIVEEALAEAGSSPWDLLIIDKKIFNKACRTQHWLMFNNLKMQGNGDAPIDLRSKATKAALFLRDNLLETTGVRIWGLIFYYYKDGKFEVEYDYTKPEGFDD
jgi:hypothetical protein